MDQHLDRVLCIFLASALLVAFSMSSPCIPKNFGHGSTVCVCNASYCDEFAASPKLEAKQFVVYTSTKDGLRFNRTIQKLTERNSGVEVDLKIQINTSVHFQSILGFGGAFTGIEVNLLFILLDYKMRTTF